MNKKLTARTQILNPSVDETTSGFSHSIVIEPETKELLLKKGTIYAVFDISGNTQFDIGLVSNVIKDVLHDSYYQAESISPIQSLEKAIVDVRDKVTKLSRESISPEDKKIQFNMLAGVLWGNVMYVVQFGNGKSFLVRENNIKPVSTMSEGSFSAASGVTKEEDVIIFCSESFGNNYPPEKLLKMAISDQNLKPMESCILMKFLIDTSFTEDEVVDFGLKDKIKKKKDPIKTLTGKFGSIKGLFKKQKSTLSDSRLSDSADYPGGTQEQAGHKVRGQFQPQSQYQEQYQEQEQIQKQDGTQAQTTKSIVPGNKPGIKLKNPKKFIFKPNLKTIIVLLGVVFMVSVFFTVTKRGKIPDRDNSMVTEIPQAEVNGAEDINKEPETAGESDEEIFYDVKITDSQADPEDIVVFNNTIVVTDKNTGKIFVSDTVTPKFELLEDTFAGMDNALNIQGELGFTDNEGYKVYNLGTESISESYASDELGLTSAYSDFLYSINGDTLTRYIKGEGTLSGSVWGTSEEFSEARSMGISYSIFLITQNGELVSYTTGNKDAFTVSAEAGTFNNPVQVLADIDFENIYIADKGNKRVVVLDDSGNFVNEYKARKEDRWNDIKSISVSPDESVLYVLNGSRVYKVDLK